jgi:Domain of unknown function DUF29
MNPATHLYDSDFYAWTQEQADLLRQREWDLVDIDNMLEEIESLGRRERRELSSRLAIVLGHLLKWQFQPDRRSHSWQATLREQRRQLRKVIKDNPSLKSELPEFLSDAYESGLLLAVQQTNLAESTFPQLCLYTLEQVMDDHFLPEP